MRANFILWGFILLFESCQYIIALVLDIFAWSKSAFGFFAYMTEDIIFYIAHSN